MCTLKHLTFKFFESFENSINFKNSFSFTPNLFSIFPVDIFLIVLASVSGFNLIPTKRFLVKLKNLILVLMWSQKEN